MTDAKPPAQDDAGTQAAGLSPDDSARLLELFEAVIDLPPDAREARIDALCGDRPELAQALRALIERDARTGPLDRDLAGSLQPLLHEALPALERTPERIGAYQILRLLGEGGMGRVYLARRVDSPVEHTVALKLMRPDRVAPGLLARFEAERQHLAALDHPGICRFIDAGALDDGSPYVVMEAVEGEPLLAYAQRRGLDLRARVELLRLLLAAVAHAHDRLRVHRDIKPQNVLVNAEGQPKLLDFGIAKSIEDERASVTRTAERFFTPNASAPEQLLGQASGVACDVYGLGALAYELLSGALPFDFEGLRAAEIERLILQVAPPLMSERSAQPWARELRGDLDAIIATCLRKSPAERYRNVLALDAELQRWLEGRPVAARAPSWAYRARLFARRHRSAVALSAALTLAILGSASALAYQALQLREQRNLALVERDRALKVVEILESAFRNADPAQAAGDTVTARQILDAAVPNIETLRASQPEVYVRLASTLARVELDLGNHLRATELIERGLAAAGEDDGSSHVSQLHLMGAMAFARTGRVAKSRWHFEQLMEKRPTPSAELDLAHARVLYGEYKYAEALHQIDAALSRGEPRLEDPQELVANELRWLKGSILRDQRNFVAAAEQARATLDWQLELLPPSHPRVLRSRHHLLRFRSRIEDAETLVQESMELLEEMESVHRGASAELSVLNAFISSLHSSMGHKQEAISYLRKAHNQSRTARGETHADTLRIQITLANFIFHDKTRAAPNETVALLQHAFRTCRSEFNPWSGITLVAQQALIKALFSRDEWSEGLSVADMPVSEDLPRLSQSEDLSTYEQSLRIALESDACANQNPQTQGICARLGEKLDSLAERN